MQGRSFVPVLTGEKNSHRQEIITGYHAAEDRCMRDLTWSFIQRPEGQPDELYNLNQDPLEKHNLIDDHTDEAKRLANSFGHYFRQRGTRVIKGIQGKYELSSSGLS
jgi:arylsulfatase A-like enzyme